MKRVFVFVVVFAAVLAIPAREASASPITGVYTTGGATTGTGPWLLTATSSPATFSFLSFTFAFPVVFDSFADLSWTSSRSPAAAGADRHVSCCASTPTTTA